MRRLTSQIVVAVAVTLAVLLGSGGPVASAHGLIPTCSYVIVASYGIYDGTGNHIAQLRIWDYTCNNLAHAQVYSDDTNCINVYGLNLYNNNNNTGSSGGPATLCNPGTSVNTGVVLYQSGAMTADTNVTGNIYFLSAVARRL